MLAAEHSCHELRSSEVVTLVSGQHYCIGGESSAAIVCCAGGQFLGSLELLIVITGREAGHVTHIGQEHFVVCIVEAVRADTVDIEERETESGSYLGGFSTVGIVFLTIRDAIDVWVLQSVERIGNHARVVSAREREYGRAAVEVCDESFAGTQEPAFEFFLGLLI